MLNKDHVLVSEAVCLGSVLMSSDKTYVLIPSVLGTFIGCQMPDIDTTKSKIGRYTRPLSSLISKFGHRGITHSLFGLLAFYCLVTFILRGRWFDFMYDACGSAWPLFLDWLIIGYLLHLIEDWFSRSGIIWLFPLGHYKAWYPPMPLKTIHGRYHTIRYDKRHEPPIYVRTRIQKWFRYYSTDRGRKGRYERWIRCIAQAILITEVLLFTAKMTH